MKTLTPALLFTLLLSLSSANASTNTLPSKRESLQVVKHKKLKRRRKVVKKNRYWTTKRFKLKVMKGAHTS